MPPSPSHFPQSKSTGLTQKLKKKNHLPREQALPGHHAQQDYVQTFTFSVFLFRLSPPFCPSQGAPVLSLAEPEEVRTQGRSGLLIALVPGISTRGLSLTTGVATQLPLPCRDQNTEVGAPPHRHRCLQSLLTLACTLSTTRGERERPATSCTGKGQSSSGWRRKLPSQSPFLSTASHLYVQGGQEQTAGRQGELGWCCPQPRSNTGGIEVANG